MIKADIPQDIREYKEQFFFGLNLRQLICAVIILLVAVGTFLLGRDFIRTDILMYVLVLEVAPIAAVGFLKYNGLTAEQFLLAWMRSEILMPKHVVFRPVNIWYELMKSTIEKKESENLIEHEQNLK